MSESLLQKISLALALLLSVAAGVADSVVSPAYAPDVQEHFRALLAARSAGGGPSFVVLAAVYEILLLSAVVGMFRQQKWGLQLGLGVTVLTMLQALTMGPHAYSGAAFMLSYAGKVAWGAALALTYTLMTPRTDGNA